MIDKGIVEIGGKRREVALEDILKLKSILDELCIMHIFDGVTIFSAFNGDKRTVENRNVRMRMAGKDGRVILKGGFGHSGPVAFREMIIPYFYEIDFMSLTQLDYEEAEFIGDLLYGNEY